ncbi:MAG: energy-coupling factor transporter transmembrane protein EcfT, partial [Oscillospiraceae bacterium]|nr:energy-coupling factor transporter transmembrane protein EcfT [Oscillospiraceae bacterium]
MKPIFNYIDRPSPIHRLSGATKLVCLLLWSFAAMLTFDTRLVAALAVLSFALLRLSRIRLSDVSFLLKLTIFFMLFNNLVLFLFSPQYGVEIYGTKHVLFGSGRFTLTQEQLFYHLNQMLKCFAMVPVVLLFVCTTQPSEFAASLNRIGVKYTVAYSVALALRYIP